MVSYAFTRCLDALASEECQHPLTKGSMLRLGKQLLVYGGYLCPELFAAVLLYDVVHLLLPLQLFAQAGLQHQSRIEHCAIGGCHMLKDIIVYLL
jgi:hypothetical protein